MPELTLCMIARDEAERIGACLASAAPAVDRIVVVDTGSRDATREIARAAGAELVDFAWRDDFAAARNAALARVKAGYVLVLDADEVLLPEGVAAVRAIAQRGELDLGLLALHDASREGAAPAEVVSGAARRGEPRLLPRLLRRTPDLRYEGAIHESVDRWARRHRKIGPVAAPIAHYGAVPELRLRLAKNERNRRLLLAQLEREPGHPLLLAHLAVEWTRAGDGTRALEAAEAAWAALRRTANGAGSSFDPVLPATVLAQLLIVTGALERADEVLEEARAAARHPNLDFLAGLCAERRHVRRGAGRDALARAAAHYAASLGHAGRLFTSEVIPGASGWQAQTRLGTVALLAGDAAGALSAFDCALRESPALREAQLGRVEALIANGDAARALGESEALLLAPDADAWLLAARAALALGALPDAQAFVARARALRATHAFVAEHRDLVLAELEARLAAPAQRALRVFAWPRYDDAEDVDALLRDFGAPLADRAGVELWLRFDPAADGAPPDAQRAIEASYARHVPAGASLHVQLFDELREPASAAAATDVAVELPSARRDPARAAFLAGLGARRATSGESLRGLLGVTR